MDAFQVLQAEVNAIKEALKANNIEVSLPDVIEEPKEEDTQTPEGE